MSQQLKEALEKVLPEKVYTTGRIARLEKVFGFIEGKDGVDYFFHWKSVNRFSRQFRAFKVGDEVKFVAEKGDRGPKAVDIYVEPLST